MPFEVFFSVLLVGRFSKQHWHWNLQYNCNKLFSTRSTDSFHHRCCSSLLLNKFLISDQVPKIWSLSSTGNKTVEQKRKATNVYHQQNHSNNLNDLFNTLAISWNPRDWFDLTMYCILTHQNKYPWYNQNYSIIIRFTWFIIIIQIDGMKPLSIYIGQVVLIFGGLGWLLVGIVQLPLRNSKPTDNMVGSDMRNLIRYLEPWIKMPVHSQGIKSIYNFRKWIQLQKLKHTQ